MRWRVLIWLVLGGTLGVLVWCWSGHRQALSHRLTLRSAAFHAPALPGPGNFAIPQLSEHHAGSPKSFPYRLRNTLASIDDLIRGPTAILLENASLDTRLSVDLPFPSNLRSTNDPGSYIVQSRGECGASFRLKLDRAGAKIISYIPNNAYLVLGDAEIASLLMQDPQIQAVLPYEPYYKLKPSLLEAVLSPGTTPELMAINVLVFAGTEQKTLTSLQRTGIEVLGTEGSPFGMTARLRCSTAMLPWIAGLPGVQELEHARVRVQANDLNRVRLGVAANSVTNLNYLGLTGSNVLVNVNDLGVDANHPDLSGRVVSDLPGSGVDVNGHGTHVAGIIAGNGSSSLTVASAPGSVLPPVLFEFRGLAPAARILSIGMDTNANPLVSDSYLQQTAATSRALISNNSWHYADDTEYDLAAASYDAAVRDALPQMPGAQPLLLVFAAGNSGHAADNGTGGLADSIQSPGTAKNVITVGAIEAQRFITNQARVWVTNGSMVTCVTNSLWLPLTDNSNQVAGFSSRGNVGLGVEGAAGRFKPDLVAPGTFLISTRSISWDQAAYYSSTNNSPNLVPGPGAAEVLSNLNDGLGPFYRFESGTSLSAASVSGTLALMQQFFQERLGRTNSPALWKALLINGARSLGSGYDLHASGPTNAQGWGVVQLPNSLPAQLTNPPGPGNALWMFDQTPDEALATAQSRTRFVSVAPAAQTLPLRITLAWTDPPGNPVAGVKLVNDLDLIVTNLQTGEVFWGNDIPRGALFNAAWPPTTPPNQDRVNNVENVYLAPNLGSNYSVTVFGRRVGVNAVTAAAEGVLQDYALVLSSGDEQLTGALTVTEAPLQSGDSTLVTPLTNSFASATSDFGAVLLEQRVGAIDPALGTNTIPWPGNGNAVLTIGTTKQWHFYVFTNDTPFTNAVFLTFRAHPLSPLPTFPNLLAAGSPTLWTASADLDLYVSRDSALTNLAPAALAAADHSFGRGGSEMILYSNATPGVYYIGVKSESLQGVEYGFVADVSEQPFAQADEQGNELLRGFPEPAGCLGGTASNPSQMYVFHLSPDSFPVHRAIVTNILSFASLADFSLSLSHASGSAVLHNFTSHGSDLAPALVYDDSGEGDLPGVLTSDGPGTLRQFTATDAQGQWLITALTTNQPLTNLASSIFLERQPDLAGTINVTLLPGICREDFLTIPMEATNLTASLTLLSGTGQVSLQVISRDASLGGSVTETVSASGASATLTVDATSNPPLNPGVYAVRSCNLGPEPVDVMIQASLVSDAAPPQTNVYVSTAVATIPDAALSTSILNVTNAEQILSAEVSVRIDHPRVSDMVLSLVSPDGARVLLDSGRGGASLDGLGSNLLVTNTTPIDFFGGPLAVTNLFETGETSGTILIDFDFFAAPDEMQVYYETNLLFDSGLVSFAGATNVEYGPGNSTSFTIVMNQGGNDETNTAWHYSVTTTDIKPLYVTFTENTNLTITPIKFAPNPLTNYTTSPVDGSVQSGIFYLPEESLNELAGHSAAGPWTLELWDTRAGATNPAPKLVSWQLALVLDQSLPTPVSLIHDSPVTNLLGPGQIQWYAIDVPDWVSFATNALLNSTAPVNVFFNAHMPPTGTNATDSTLALGSSSGVWELRTDATPLLAGSRYYIGVQNTNAVTISETFAVDFDVGTVVTLSSEIPYWATNPGPFNKADFYRYVVSTNAVRVQFEVNGPTSDVTLIARKGAPLPRLANYDYISSNPGTNDELIVVYDYSEPVPLSAGEWFLAVVNATGRPADYSILVNEYSAYGTNIVLSEPVVDTSLCFGWNALPGAHYFLEGKAGLNDPSWTILSPTLTPSDYTTSFCLPLPSPFEYFRIAEGVALGPSFPTIDSIQWANPGNLLRWTAATNSQYVVQWTSSLSPANWRSIPGAVKSTDGSFSFLDDGTQTGGLTAPRFYRLEQEP